MRLNESIKDEEQLQLIAHSLTNVLFDRYDQGIYRSEEIRKLVPPRVLGHLLGRLGQINVVYHRPLGGNSGAANFGLKMLQIDANQIATNNRRKVESVIIHELRHFIDNSKISHNVKNMNLRNDGKLKSKHIIRHNVLDKQHKGTKDKVDLSPEDTRFYNYRARHIEVGARVSEAFNYLKNELEKLNTTSVTNAKLKELVYDALDKHDLIRIFSTDNSDKMVGDAEQLKIFGRETPRILDYFVPTDNKEFRHLFSRLLSYAYHYLEKLKASK